MNETIWSPERIRGTLAHTDAGRAEVATRRDEWRDFSSMIDAPWSGATDEHP